VIGMLAEFDPYDIDALTLDRNAESRITAQSSPCPAHGTARRRNGRGAAGSRATRPREPSPPRTEVTVR
jgi:hypothetical protein